MWKLVDLLLEKLFAFVLARSHLVLNGSSLSDPVIHDPGLYRRVLLGASPSLELGEAYMRGEWDCHHLDHFFARLITNPYVARIRRLARCFSGRPKQDQSKALAKDNVAHHYDIGEDIYEAQFRGDPYRQYSCAYWDWGARSLQEAQWDKLRKLCGMLQLQHGIRVLDVGGGWGGLSKFMAEEYGVHVTMITLSENQARYARNVMCKNVSDGSVEVLLMDYRDMPAQCKGKPYDRIISVGMFEHVGLEYYDAFMRCMEECLAGDGIFVLHFIHGHGRPDSWISKYIFPSGFLPTWEMVSTPIEKTGFHVWDRHEIGKNYAPTLQAWYDNFAAGWQKLLPKYGRAFFRMWRYYLLQCAGLFFSGYLGVWQMVLSKRQRPREYDPIRRLGQC